MRQKIVAANWKMNGQLKEIIHLINQIKDQINPEDTAQVVILPPAIYIPLVNELLGDSCIALGAQNIYPKDSGAFTGEMAISMFKEFQCAYALVGHSERRQYFCEDEKFVAQKFHHVKEHGIIPILCVGETLVERENGQTEQIISSQIMAVCGNDKNCFQKCIIAYEPVWAIGTGKTATPDEAQEVHQFIRNIIADLNHSDAERLPIIYGGSVNETNAAALFAMPDIDGGLVGGASLNAKQFVEIVKCIN